MIGWLTFGSCEFNIWFVRVLVRMGFWFVRWFVRAFGSCVFASCAFGSWLLDRSRLVRVCFWFVCVWFMYVFFLARTYFLARAGIWALTHFLVWTFTSCVCVSCAFFSFVSRARLVCVGGCLARVDICLAWAFVSCGHLGSCGFGKSC